MSGVMAPKSTRESVEEFIAAAAKGARFDTGVLLDRMINRWDPAFAMWAWGRFTDTFMNTAIVSIRKQIDLPALAIPYPMEGMDNMMFTTVTPTTGDPLWVAIKAHYRAVVRERYLDYWPGYWSMVTGACMGCGDEDRVPFSLTPDMYPLTATNLVGRFANPANVLLAAQLHPNRAGFQVLRTYGSASMAGVRRGCRTACKKCGYNVLPTFNAVQALSIWETGICDDCSSSRLHRTPHPVLKVDDLRKLVKRSRDLKW